jgi:hypothetical protein
MLNKNIKLIIAGLIVIVSIWQFTENNIGNGIFLLLLTVFPIFLYFKNEFILLAFLKLRKQDFEGAKKWLSFIKKPETALITCTGLWFRKQTSTKRRNISRKQSN